nr:hypothetical protein [Streptomyces sp. NRRL S-813]
MFRPFAVALAGLPQRGRQRGPRGVLVEFVGLDADDLEALRTTDTHRLLQEPCPAHARGSFDEQAHPAATPHGGVGLPQTASSLSRP